MVLKNTSFWTDVKPFLLLWPTRKQKSVERMTWYAQISNSAPPRLLARSVRTFDSCGAVEFSRFLNSGVRALSLLCFPRSIVSFSPSRNEIDNWSLFPKEITISSSLRVARVVLLFALCTPLTPISFLAVGCFLCQWPQQSLKSVSNISWYDETSIWSSFEPITWKIEFRTRRLHLSMRFIAFEGCECCRDKGCTRILRSGSWKILIDNIFLFQPSISPNSVRIPGLLSTI